MPAADERDGRAHLADRPGIVAAHPMIGITARVLERIAQPHHLAAGETDVEFIQLRIRQRRTERPQTAVDQNRGQPAFLEGDQHQP